MAEIPLPPQDLRRVGHGDLQQMGRFLLDRLVDHGLRPEHRVLDVGSGIGRVAVPMTAYLTTGTYEGFDIDREMVTWCQENVTPSYPHFRFQVADVYSPAYNPAGAYRAEDYRFPYEDASFDYVLLTSVFTHMPPREVDRYLSEITRVLVPGGIASITWFLIDRDSRRILLNPGTRPSFRFRRRKHRIANAENPAVAVAHNLRNVKAMYRRNGLAIRKLIRGKWRQWGGDPGSIRQDLIVATTPPSPG